MQLHYQLVHVASRVQTWAEECVHLHEVLKIFLAFHAQSYTFIRPRLNSAHWSCMPSLLLYALGIILSFVALIVLCMGIL